MSSTTTSTTITSNVIVFFDSAQPSAHLTPLDGFKTCQVSMPIAIQRALTTDDMQRIVGAVQREIDTIKDQEDEWNAHLERNRRALQDLFQQQQQQQSTQKRSATEANEADEAEPQTKKKRQEEEKKVEGADCIHDALYSTTSPIYMPNDTPLVCPNCATVVQQTDVTEEVEDAPTSPVYDPTSPDYSPIEEQEVAEKKSEEAVDADAAEEMELEMEKQLEEDEQQEKEANSPFYTPTSPSYSKDTRCLGTVGRGPRKGQQCQWTAQRSNDLGLCSIHWKQLHKKTEREQRLKRISDTVDRAIKTIANKHKFDADFRPLILTRSKSVDV